MISSRILLTKFLGYFLEKVLFEYADCVGEGRCVCIGTQELGGFSYHQSLEDTPGVGRGKMEIIIRKC